MRVGRVVVRRQRVVYWLLSFRTEEGAEIEGRDVYLLKSC
jgi:hypothetical protein